MLPILRTRRADEDLIEIWNWITADSPAAADRVLDAIEARWSQLALYPQSGVARNDIAPGIRVLSAGQYLTLYWIDDTSVTVLRLLHGKRRVGEQDVE